MRGLVALLLTTFAGEAHADAVDAYQRALVQALTAGARLKEVDRYTPPAEVVPRHTVHVFATPERGAYWYVSDGFGVTRQPGGTPGAPDEFVELATYADHQDLRIAEILSLFGEAMHARRTGGPFNAWSYDTISLPQEVYGLRYFVLRPGAEVKLTRKDGRPSRVSIFTVIPLTAAERAEVANVGRESARAWVEKRAVGEPAAMLARWKLTPPPR